jgi:hypothetical protein
MTARRALFTLLVAGLVLLVAGANPRTKAGEGNGEQQVAGQARVLSPAPGSLSSSAAFTATPCFRPGPLIEVHIATPTIWLGDVAYNLRHDEYLLVWSMEQSVQTHEVWAARVGPYGDVRGTFKVAGEQGKYLDEPAVAYSSEQDEYLVAYNLSLTGSADVDVYAKRLSWDGGWKSNQFAIRTEPDQQWGPKVAHNEAHGEYLVVYWNQWAGGLQDIAAQRVRARDGALLSWRNIATGANENRRTPDVAYNPARDEYLVVYDYIKGTSLQIRGSRFNHDMGTLYPEMAISDQTNYPSDSRVAAGPNEYLILWSTYTFGTDRDIRGRLVSGDGIPQGASAGFNIAGAGTTEGYSHPDVAYSEALGYPVAMEYEPPDTRTDVVAGLVTPGHDSAPGELFPLFDFPALQNSPHVACSPQGHCLIVERDTWDPAELNRWAIRGLVLGVCPRVFLPLVVRSY